MKYTQHPIGALLPSMAKEQYAELLNDIKSNELRDPITLYEDQILDGWHRYRVCEELNIEPRFTTYDGNNPAGYVLSKETRRHLTAGQKAIFAVEILPLIEAEAKKRKTYKHLDTYSLTTKIVGHENESTYKAAKIAGSNHNSVQFIKKLKKEHPDMLEKVRKGSYSIEDAKRNIKAGQLESKKIEIAQQSKAAIVNDYKPQIYNLDCNVFLKTYENNSIDCLLTDPPYSTDIEDINTFVQSWLPLALSKVKSNGRCYICTGAYPSEIQAYLNVLLKQDKFIVDNPLIWTYRNTLGVTPKNKYNMNYQMIWHLYTTESNELDTSITNEMFSVQNINAPDGRIGNRFHTWQKPDELAERFIRHGTKENDIVVDPFCCTGTFVIAAAKAKRKAFGSDINNDNLNIAISRGCICGE